MEFTTTGPDYHDETCRRLSWGRVGSFAGGPIRRGLLRLGFAGGTTSVSSAPARSTRRWTLQCPGDCAEDLYARGSCDAYASNVRARTCCALRWSPSAQPKRAVCIATITSAEISPASSILPAPDPGRAFLCLPIAGIKAELAAIGTRPGESPPAVVERASWHVADTLCEPAP